MILHQMLSQFNHILAVEMDQFSTFLAFTVKTDGLMTVFLCPKVFKAGTACPVYIILGNQTLLYHLLQITG